MQNDMRDRLKDLIKETHCVDLWDNYNDEPKKPHPIETLADHLIANGVVVLDMKVLSPKNIPLVTHFANMPLDEVFELVKAKQQGKIIELPCNVGDTVYQVGTDRNVYESTIKNIIYDTTSIAFDERAIGESIFLTKEQAEQKLKELSENGNL